MFNEKGNEMTNAPTTLAWDVFNPAWNVFARIRNDLMSIVPEPGAAVFEKMAAELEISGDVERLMAGNDMFEYEPSEY